MYYEKIKKISLAIVFVSIVVLPVKAYAFRAAGFGFGPNINLRGDLSTSFMMEGDLNLHKNVGAKLFVGVHNGFWIGTALNTIFSLYESSSGGFDDSVNFSIPFMVNINNGVKTAFIGLTAGNTLYFAADEAHKYYFFITPAELMIIPVAWSLSPGSGFSTGLSFSVMSSVGLKVRL